MTQEQKDAIKLAGQTKYPSKGHEAAVKRLHFSWGCTHVINHAAQFGLVDSIKADTVLHVGLAQLEAENTRLRDALERIVNYNYDTRSVAPHHIAKEALKNNEG